MLFARSLLLLSFCLLAWSRAAFAQEAQLARNYFATGEFEKAAEIYKKLHEKDRNNDYWYERYLLTLFELEDYKEAEQVVKRAIKNEPGKIHRYIDYGIIFERQGQIPQANEQYDKAIKLLPNITDIEQVNKLANLFVQNKKFEYAIQTYEKAEKQFKQKYLFAFDLGNVYRAQGKTPEMIDAYLDCLEHPTHQLQLTNIQGYLQRQLTGDGIELLKTKLYERIQKSQNTLYPEMLIWVFMQEGDYANALRQAKSLDKRLNEDGTRIYKLAQNAIAERKYDAGIEAYSYLVAKGLSSPYYIDAKQRLLAAKRDRLVDGYAYTQPDLIALENEYEDFLKEFGRNLNTAAIMQQLAEFEARYLNNINKSISLLEEVVKIPGLQRANAAEAKLELGDYYLMKGEVWEATLLYSQVDKDLRDAPLGEAARFKNAKLSYYKGEFEWAQDQLNVLKGSTSELISNDAIELSVFIMEHYNLDTSELAMRRFAAADLLLFQNRFDDAFAVMDSILKFQKGHGLEDDIFYVKADIYTKKRQYQTAVELYERIINEHKDGILVDNALFRMAELYETRLNDPKKAMDLYQKILIDHSGSTFTVEARKRFRRLRGDNV